MIILNNYKNILDYYANTPANMVDKQQYQYNAGTNFELDINDTIIKNMNSFFLYWQMQFRFNSSFNWSLNLSSNNIFTSKNNNYNTSNNDVSFLFQDENNMFTMDHMLITPYAVFILEAKNHKANNKYISKLYNWQLVNKKLNTIIYNPVLQVLKYKAVTESFMAYYNINLPIIPRVVFKQHVNLDSVTDLEKQFCIYPGDLFKIIENAKNDYLFQPNEALKFAKTLYYYGCHPIAYDNNKINWSISK